MGPAALLLAWFPVSPPHGGAYAPPTPSSSGPAAQPATDVSPGAETDTWDLWWHLNRARYLELRAHVLSTATITGSDDFFLGHGMENGASDRLIPSQEVIRNEVEPALFAALELGQSRDMTSSALVALAKLGEVENSDTILGWIEPYLASTDAETAEAAIIALGILGNPKAVPVLADLLQNGRRARTLVRDTSVHFRLRAFAAYALGLIGRRPGNADLRRAIAEKLIGVLEGEAFLTRDIKIAALTALGTVPIELELSVPALNPGTTPGAHAHHVLSRRTQIAYVLGWLARPRRGRTDEKRPWRVRAHAPITLARLASEVPDELRAHIAEALLVTLDKNTREPDELKAGAVLALGAIGTAGEHSVDIRIRARLSELVSGGDRFSRRFALIALGQVGGRRGTAGQPFAGSAACRERLAKTLSRGTASLRPWAGLALGLLGYGLRDNQIVPDGGTGRALQLVASECRRPHEIGAYALALGLRSEPGSAKILLGQLENVADDEARGDLAVALGLCGDPLAKEPLRQIVRKGKYRPHLLSRAAEGLGLMGDKAAVPELLAMLRTAKGLASQAAIASALGAIGDGRSIDPLLGMLADETLTKGARAFAAVALGAVCDKDRLPWNEPFSTGANYHAFTSSIVGGARGVLDIL